MTNPKQVKLMLTQHITPIDHHGDISKEVMDVVAAHGDLLNAFLQTADGTAAGSYEAISMKSQRLIIEAEDLAHKICKSETQATKNRLAKVAPGLSVHEFLKVQL